MPILSYLHQLFNWRGVDDKVGARRRWKRPCEFPILSDAPAAPSHPYCS
jgi:hypothetical protein